MRLLISALLLFVLGCQSTSKLTSVPSEVTSSTVLFNVDNEPILAEEFVYVYKKNNANNDSAYTKADIDEYFELYKKFKLKIAEAKNLGMDTTKAFRTEFDTYRDQLKKPYLSESKVTEQLVREAYDRYKQEVNASHILIKLAKNPPPADTLAAYNKAIEIRDKALNGADFAELAKTYSDDPSAQENGGSLGYFTSFQMVYPFESAAYTTVPGQISPPTRTRFGYHIIKVNDKRTASGTVGVSHIMLRFSPDQGDSAKVRDKIFEIYDQSQGGVPWNDLTIQFSEDVNSKNNGGKLRPFTVGQMPLPFQEAAFSLSEIGEISDPVMTQFGWHILKLDSKETVQPFEQLEGSIKSKINRDVRAQLSKKLLISKLKKENNFILNEPVKEELFALNDSALSTYNTLPISNKLLFTIGDQPYNLSSFFEYFENENGVGKSLEKKKIVDAFYEYEAKSVLGYEEDHLAEKYIDYRMLVKEYREGILLFQLMEDEIWSKAVEDSVGLEKYYEKHADDYQWDSRAKAVIYNAANQGIIRELKGILRSSDSIQFNKTNLEKRFNDDSQLNLQISQGIFERKKNRVFDGTDWVKGTFEVEQDGRYNLVVIEEILPPGPKALNEIKGLVISDYQDHLEQLWLVELAKKYPIEINKEGLKSVYGQLQK